MPPEIGECGPSGFTVLDVDGDGVKEIVLLTESAVFLANLDIPNLTLVNVRTLEDAAGPIGGGTFAASGDFDADGVPDLAIAGDNDVRLYRGIAKP
jgi:hypothetical protein